MVEHANAARNVRKVELHPTTLTRLLDEIERLRGVLGQEHASDCELLRSESACSCGCMTRATTSLLENVELRAEIQNLNRTLIIQRVELARMDAKVHEARRSVVAVQMPGTLAAAA